MHINVRASTHSDVPNRTFSFFFFFLIVLCLFALRQGHLTEQEAHTLAWAIWPERSQEPPFYPSVLGLVAGVAMPNFYVHAKDLNSGPGFSEDLAISPVFNQTLFFFFFNQRRSLILILLFY